MRINIQSVNINKIIDAIAVATIVFSSGANVFLRSIFFIVIVSSLLFLRKRKIKNKAILIAIPLISFVLVDSIVINVAPTDYKECILLIIRLLCIVIIFSNLSQETFQKYYIILMEFLAVLSLVCFLALKIGIHLPGAVSINGYYTTFYQCIGFGTDYVSISKIRNCGVFSEPGIYQMYLNIALLFLWQDMSMQIKKVRKLFVLFSITLLTTMSAMGYIIYFIIFLMFVIYRSNIFGFKVNKRCVVGGLLLLSIVCVFLEIRFGILQKFIVNTNSYASRHDDTLLTFLIARDYPLFGVGLATNPIGIWNLYYDKYEMLRLYKSYQAAMSCGIGNYAFMGGLPFALVYFIMVVKSYFCLFKTKGIIQNMCIVIIVILLLLEEPLMPTPFMLMSFFVPSLWGKGKKEKKCYESVMDCNPSITRNFI